MHSSIKKCFHDIGNDIPVWLTAYPGGSCGFVLQLMLIAYYPFLLLWIRCISCKIVWSSNHRIVSLFSDLHLHEDEILQNHHWHQIVITLLYTTRRCIDFEIFKIVLIPFSSLGKMFQDSKVLLKDYHEHPKSLSEPSTLKIRWSSVRV